jgi:hypothetical protein
MTEESSNINGTAKGPFIYLNWIAANKGKKPLWICEYPLLTDAHITGEATEGYGPYKFINPLPMPPKRGLVRPGMVLRLEHHFKDTRVDLTKTDTEFYHGGGFLEEIAALFSLAIGIRTKSGGLIREFEQNGDPLGRPRAYDDRPNPILGFGRHRCLILPRVVGSHSLEKLIPLSWLLKISPEDAIALIRAARLYQDALWIAESEPALSWIMFVSALETAANQWRREKDSPIERLEASKPELLEILRENCNQGIPEKVAGEIADSLGSASKFVNFVLNFLPDKPIRRPIGWLQFKWSNTSIRKTLSKIYDYRSRALHDGTPFPAPMCDPPFYNAEWGVTHSEKPLGGAVGAMGGTWLAEDIPILLHSFEYITRGALLNWWKYISKN